MKRLAKFYPKKDLDFEGLIDAIKKEGLDGLCISAIFEKTAHFNTESMPYSGFDLSRLKEKMGIAGLELGLILPFFHDELVFEKSPEKRAVMDIRSWYRPLCPLYPGLFSERWAMFKDAISQIKPDFIALDFFRFPLFWEGVNEERDLVTCNCKRCQNTPDRKKVIEALAKEVKDETDVDVIIHLVPFLDQNAQDVTGQDPNLLKDSAYALSPMLYHNLLKRDASFTAKALEKLHGTNIWPSFEIEMRGKRHSDSCRDYEKVIYFYFRY